MRQHQKYKKRIYLNLHSSESTFLKDAYKSFFNKKQINAAIFWCSWCSSWNFLPLFVCLLEINNGAHGCDKTEIEISKTLQIPPPL